MFEVIDAKTKYKRQGLCGKLNPIMVITEETKANVDPSILFGLLI